MPEVSPAHAGVELKNRQRKILSVPLSGEEHEIVRSLAREWSVSMTEVLRRGLWLQRRISQLERQGLIVTGPDQNGNGTRSGIPVSTLLSLIR